MLDHIGVRVSDYDRSRDFYVGALAPLGYSLVMEPAPGVGGFGPEFPDFWIFTADAPSGPAHVAFRTGSREVVDAFHAAALAVGGRDNGGPGVREIYHPQYYGAYVLDPDGHNVEAVCHEPA